MTLSLAIEITCCVILAMMHKHEGTGSVKTIFSFTLTVVSSVMDSLCTSFLVSI